MRGIGQTMGLLLALSLGRTAFAQPAEFRLPAPEGQYVVGTTSYEWEDTSRQFAYSSFMRDSRRIVVQVWYPSQPDAAAQMVPYSTQSQQYQHVKTNSQLLSGFAEGVTSCPLVLISPGRGMHHSAYTGIAESLASKGYVVAAVGMPGIGFVRFGDGYVAQPNPNFRPSRELMSGPYEKVDQFFEKPTALGLQDIRFALSKLSRLNEGDPSGRFTGRLDLSKIGIFGHSLGGRIAGAFAAENDQVRAYISMEGIAPRKVRFDGLLKMPVAMLCSSGTLPYAEVNYQTLIDGRSETVFMIELQQFGHNSVTDLPLISPTSFNYAVEPAVGWETSIRIVNAYFDAYLKSGKPFLNAVSNVDLVLATEFAGTE